MARGDTPLTPSRSPGPLLSLSIYPLLEHVELLKSDDEQVRLDAANALGIQLSALLRELTDAAIRNELESLSQTLSKMAEEGSFKAMRAAILCIEQIALVGFSLDSRLCLRYLGLVNRCFQVGDIVLATEAARIHALLCSRGGLLMLKHTDAFLKTAVFESAQGKRSELRRHIAVLCLRDLVKLCPKLMAPHQLDCLDHLPTFLSDASPEIREIAGQTLGYILELMKNSTQLLEADERYAIYNSFFESAERAVKDRLNHAGATFLLVARELALHADQFLSTRLSRVYKVVQDQARSSDVPTRDLVFQLLPLFADYDSAYFSESHILDRLLPAMLPSIMSASHLSSTGLQCIGRLSIALPSDMSPYVGSILAKLKPILLNSRAAIFQDTLFDCLSSMLQVLSSHMDRDIVDIMDYISGEGFGVFYFTKSFSAFFDTVCLCLPSSAEKAAQVLLDYIGWILAKRRFDWTSGEDGRLVGLLATSFSNAIDPPPTPKRNSLTSSLTNSFLWSPQAVSMPRPVEDIEIQLAMEAVIGQGGAPVDICTFVCGNVVPYLKHQSVSVRLAAVATSCFQLSTGGFDPYQEYNELGLVLALLSCAVTDPEPIVRETLLQQLISTDAACLRSTDCVHAVSFTLTDSEQSVRLLAAELIGRASGANPAAAEPILRRILIEALLALEFESPSRRRSETFDFLSALLRFSHSSIDWPIDLLAKKLFGFASGADKLTSCSILACLGVLAEQAGASIARYETEYLDYLESAVNDVYVASKRLHACKTLAIFISHAGLSIKIRQERPWLVSTILRLLQDASERPDIRHAASLAFGLMGASDPLMSSGQGSLSHPVYGSLEAVGEEDFQKKELAVTDPNFYSEAVFSSLRDALEGAPSTSQVALAFDAVAVLAHALRWRIRPYVYIVPLLLEHVQQAPLSQRNHHLTCLLTVVNSLGQHLVTELQPMLRTVCQLWPDSTTAGQLLLIELMKALSGLSPQSIEAFFDLMALFARIIHADFMTSNPVSVCLGLLETVPLYGIHLEDYIHLLFPALCQIASDSFVSVEVRGCACRSLEIFARSAPSFKLHAQLIFTTLLALLRENNDALQDACETCMLSTLAVLDRDVESFLPPLRALLMDQPSVRLTEALRLIDLGNLITPPPAHATLKSKGHTPSDSKMLGAVPVEPPCHFELLGFLSSYADFNTDDWQSWWTSFVANLLRAAPSFALQAVSGLAESSNSFSMSLLDFGMLSCYRGLSQEQHAVMVHNLHMILDSDSAPVEIRQRLLGVIEFMERKGVPLNSPLVDLARFAYKCNSLSKALRFTELQYLARPTRKTIKDMVDLSAEMLTPDSGMGILAHAQAVYGIESEPDWLERLGSWDLALAAHEKEPLDKEEGALGRLRCLSAIRDWEGAYSVVKHAWPRSKAKAELSVYALDAAWGTSDFGSFPEYLAYLPASSPDCPFYNAILAVHYNDWQSAQVHLASCRTHLDTALQPSLKDSYTRAYPLLVRAQMLAELEEAIRYKQLDGNPDAQHIIEKGFEDRLQVLSPTPETFENIMRIHGLVIPPRDDVKARSQLADIARHHGRSALANAILKGLIHSSLTSSGSAVLKGPPEAIFSKIRLLHVDQPAEAVRQLRHFAQSLPGSSTDKGRKRLKGRALRRLGDWCSNSGEQWHANVDWEVIGFYQASSDADPSWYKAFACLAIAQAALAAKQVKANQHRLDEATLHNLVLPSIRNFFKAVEKADSGQKYVLQDLLRLFDLLYTYGEAEAVSQTILKHYRSIPKHHYLIILPQIMARIDASNVFIRKTVHQVLHMLGQNYANALVYPLGVAAKDTSVLKKEAAQALLNSIRAVQPLLVEQAAAIGKELIRVSVSWLERWHTGLEQASKLFYSDGDLVQMFNQLDRLHEEMHSTTVETPDEAKFIREFGAELDRALALSRSYRKVWDTEDLNEAWAVYYKMYRTFNGAISSVTSLDLRTASPRLYKLKNVELGIPGAFRPNTIPVTIQSTMPKVSVFSSKQKPRKLSLIGSDMQEYPFLLKGHEDLRLDERVMQFLELSNRIFRKDRACRVRRLKCTLYSVVPLSSDAGLLTWLRNKDTMHMLIKEFRASRNIPLDQELRYMRAFAPKYDSLSHMQKVEAFEYAMEKSSGQDLYNILWIKSSSTETWLERRSNFSRSLATMSMVGYVLGLGDRHPSNLLIDRISGSVVHVDYSDSFEVARERDRYPETVPFRLTRMLVLCNEVSGVEGTFRVACESSLFIMRDFKESLIGLLKAFVEDPVTASFLHTRDARAMKKKALQVLARVQLKLTGRDFGPKQLQTSEQVHRLIEEATSNSNLAALYQGWCMSPPLV